MTNIFEQLKDEVKHLYSDKEITESELNEMTENLINFFAIGVQIFQEDKNKLSQQKNN